MASAGRTASTKTSQNPTRSASQGASGTRTNWGAALDSPRAPIARPRRGGATKAATAVPAHTVMMPNPSPRSAASAVTAQSRSVARCPSAGSPSRPEPSTSVQRHPRPPSRRRIDSWASTVQAIMTPVTSPAPRLSLPPRITQSGATPTSNAYPENHSVAAVSSHDMPGSRQTGRLGGACPGAVPPPGAVARRSSGTGLRSGHGRGPRRRRGRRSAARLPSSPPRTRRCAPRRSGPGPGARR